MISNILTRSEIQAIVEDPQVLLAVADIHEALYLSNGLAPDTAIEYQIGNPIQHIERAMELRTLASEIQKKVTESAQRIVEEFTK